MNTLELFLNKYFFWLSVPNITITDLIEILIIAFIIYEIMVWIKNTRAWMLFKGIIVLMAFILAASVFKMDVIVWIATKTVNVGIIVIFIIFQPELRKALEQLGRRNILKPIFSSNTEQVEKFSDRTVNEITRAAFEMGSVCTGALIVIENEISLSEFESTGIEIDAVVSSQLLINIFEHNTPLHDGAVIIRGNRITAATCYLPLSDNKSLSKELGTRHRAGVGISEITDSLTIIVSEETGKVSIACNGEIIRNIDPDYLKGKLFYKQKPESDGGKFKIWKGRVKDEKKHNS